MDVGPKEALRAVGGIILGGVLVAKVFDVFATLAPSIEEVLFRLGSTMGGVAAAGVVALFLIKQLMDYSSNGY
jgi:hypothetical protein